MSNLFKDRLQALKTLDENSCTPAEEVELCFRQTIAEFLKSKDYLDLDIEPIIRVDDNSSLNNFF